ncbi:MAG TPA: hypothetical protein VHV57_06065 [Acidimicrobiales bacterium]|jgi:hypothetical protein|nr:hypothetical protein [Acidimicrobiales bacterium]
MPDEFEPTLNWPEGTGPDDPAGLPQLNAELKYQAGAVPELDLTLSTLAGRLGQPEEAPQPWVAGKPSARRARLVRRFILVDVILLVAIVVAALAFRSHPVHLTPTAKAVPAQSLLPAGAVSQLAGATCTAGDALAAVQLTVVRAVSGLYYVAASGSVVPHSGGTLNNVSVKWAVRYADGYATTTVSRVNRGHAIAVSQSAAWSARSFYSEGSVPPAAVRVVSLVGSGTLGACR